jgi:thiamine-phosphate pyrophosphorylase
MSLDRTRPIIYLITTGQTTFKTTPDCPEFSRILQLVEAAVASNVTLIQLREKDLSARVLFELTRRAAARTRGTTSRLLVNDRFDIALAAGADGVQLTAQSLTADVVRAVCGSEFLIGVSTHSLDEGRVARDKGADFVVFGPIFETESKLVFGPAQGVERLAEVTKELKGFPVIAIGGMTIDNVTNCFSAGVAGVAAIGLLSDPETLPAVVKKIRTDSGFEI